MKRIDPALSQWTRAQRHDLHRYPEISFKEERTTEKIAEILGDLGYKLTRMQGATGVVGLMHGKADGPCMGLRADIDALPMAELGDPPYKSACPGTMHACGHDANTAIMLGTAKWLAESGFAKEICGSVKFIFQPAEERGAGAAMMLEQGVLENPRVDCLLAGHMSPDLEAGATGHFETLGYAAADKFSIQITGRGGHGGRPHESIDPIVAGSHLVSALQTIAARNVIPTDTAVVSVCKFISGNASNVIPESAHLAGTIRTFTPCAQDLVFRRMEEITAGIEAVFGVTCKLELSKGVPSVINDPKISKFLFSASQAVIGEENTRYIPPITGSEDFSFFANNCPSAIMRIGCANPAKGITAKLHSPYFDIDETALDVGVMIFSEAVKNFFDPKQSIKEVSQ